MLDTNALSEPLQRTPSARFLQRFHLHAGEMATAAPAYSEMRYGRLRLPASRRRAEIEAFIHSVVLVPIPILPHDTAAAEWHAAERARLAGLQYAPPFVDGQIAAIAAT